MQNTAWMACQKWTAYINQQFTEALRPLGLSPLAAHIVMLLCESQPLNVVQLADALSIEPSRVAYACQQLYGSQIILAEFSTKEHRYLITPLGIATADQAREALEMVNARLMQELGASGDGV